MEDGKRACVAIICVILKHKTRTANSVYDYKRGKHCFFGVNRMSNGLSVYDYDRRGFCQGTLPNFYDYCTSSFIMIRDDGDYFSGFDYKSGHYFNVTINGSYINVFDYEFSTGFTYSI